MRFQQWRRWSVKGGAGALAMIAIAGGIRLLPWTDAASRSVSAEARLVSVEALQEAAGVECEWRPAGLPAGQTLLASLQQHDAASARDKDATPTASEQAAVKNRKPLTIIKDDYSAYSAVALDLAHDEVVMTDESLFTIMSFNRTENTPPRASMSEPKRRITGLNTHIEFECGVYVDPNNGDIYAVNNDTLDSLIVFSRDQKGDAVPERELHTPHTTFGIAVDEANQELSLSVQEAAAIVTYRKNASAQELPIRLLQGDKTGLADPHGMALDTTRKLLFVANFGSVALHERGAAGGSVGGENYSSVSVKANWPLARESAIPGSGKFEPPSITVYPGNGAGNIPPLHKIVGPKTQLNWPTALSVDSKRGELFVANDSGDSVLVFDENADGDVAPIRAIKGPKSMVKNPTGVYYDEKHDELWVTNFGNHTAGVYRPSSSGDAAPIRLIRSAPLDRPTPNIANTFAAAYDSKRDEILVPNCVSHPQIATYARTANGDAAPKRSISGQKSLLSRTAHGIAYDPVRDRFMVPSFYGQAVLIYRGDTNGEQAPDHIIQGSLTQLIAPDRLAFDSVHNEIFVPQGDEVLVFDGNAQGNVAPIRVLKGPDTGMRAGNVAVDPVNDLIVVGGQKGKGDGQLQIFNRTDSGNVKPKATIRGPHSELSYIFGPYAVYPPRAEIVVPIRGYSEMASEDCFVGVWSEHDNGDVPPRWRIGGPHGILQQVRGVALDPAHKTLIITDKRINGVLTFSFPEIF